MESFKKLSILKILIRWPFFRKDPAKSISWMLRMGPFGNMYLRLIPKNLLSLFHPLRRIRINVFKSERKIFKFLPKFEC